MKAHGSTILYFQNVSICLCFVTNSPEDVGNRTEGQDQVIQSDETNDKMSLMMHNDS